MADQTSDRQFCRSGLLPGDPSFEAKYCAGVDWLADLIICLPREVSQRYTGHWSWSKKTAVPYAGSCDIRELECLLGLVQFHEEVLLAGLSPVVGSPNHVESLSGPFPFLVMADKAP